MLALYLNKFICAGFGRKTQKHWDFRKRKSGLSAIKRAVGNHARAAFAKGKKEQNHLFRSSDREVGESREARAVP